jgi:N-acetylmuramate 1-kinase
VLNTQNQLVLLKDWLQNACLLKHFTLQPLINDASFRKYFRVHTQTTSRIAMLAPLDKEDIATFIAIAKNFAGQEIYVPEILNFNLQYGFLLLSDLGDDLYLNLLNRENVDNLYQRALAVIAQIQNCKPILANNQPLGSFDETLIRFELNLFVDWFLAQHIKCEITCEYKIMLEKSFQFLVTSILEQPQACIHRDYHSRNLLLIDQQKVGVLDFQDALYGPITYDAVSLLRDAYVDWPEAQVTQWALHFYNSLPSSYQFSHKDFFRWFDWLSIQRHLKILGIFARLCYRDHKPQYLTSTKRLLQYLKLTCRKYSEFKELGNLLDWVSMQQ